MEGAEAYTSKDTDPDQIPGQAKHLKTTKQAAGRAWLVLLFTNHPPHTGQGCLTAAMHFALFMIR